MKFMVGCITITKPTLTALATIYCDGSPPALVRYAQALTPHAEICIMWKSLVALELLLVKFRH